MTPDKLSYEQQWKKERETVYKSILQELDIILSGKGEKSPCLNPNMRFQQLLSKAKLHRVTNTKIEKAKTLFKKMRKFKAVHLRKRDSVDGLGEAEIRSCTNQAPGECMFDMLWRGRVSHNASLQQKTFLLQGLYSGHYKNDDR